VEQPGVLACLSRRRSWVQIPSGTLDSTVRKPEKRRSSNLRDSVSSTLTRATDWVVFLVAACKTVVTKQARWTTRGSIPSRPTDRWPVRLTAGCETLILAMRVQFPHGSLTTAKWWNWDTRDAQNVVPFAAWEFESPLGYWVENETIAGEPALSRAS
jgi:hypothetical protein